MFYSSSSPPLSIRHIPSGYMLTTTFVKVSGNLHVAKTNHQSCFLVLLIETLSLSLSVRIAKLQTSRAPLSDLLHPLPHRRVIPFPYSSGGEVFFFFLTVAWVLRFLLQTAHHISWFYTITVRMTAEFCRSPWPHLWVSESHTLCFIYHYHSSDT